MVEELLDFSRLQNGRIQMNNHPLDLVAELTDAVLFCEARIRQEMCIRDSLRNEAEIFIGNTEKSTCKMAAKGV